MSDEATMELTEYRIKLSNGDMEIARGTDVYASTNFDGHTRLTIKAGDAVVGEFFQPLGWFRAPPRRAVLTFEQGVSDALNALSRGGASEEYRRGQEIGGELYRWRAVQTDIGNGYLELRDRKPGDPNHDPTNGGEDALDAALQPTPSGAGDEVEVPGLAEFMAREGAVRWHADADNPSERELLGKLDVRVEVLRENGQIATGTVRDFAEEQLPDEFHIAAYRILPSNASEGEEVGDSAFETWKRDFGVDATADVIDAEPPPILRSDLPPDADPLASVRQAGKYAATVGLDSSANPYWLNTSSWHAWREGYDSAMPTEDDVRGILSDSAAGTEVAADGSDINALPATGAEPVFITEANDAIAMKAADLDAEPQTDLGSQEGTFPGLNRDDAPPTNPDADVWARGHEYYAAKPQANFLERVLGVVSKQKAEGVS